MYLGNMFKKIFTDEPLGCCPVTTFWVGEDVWGCCVHGRFIGVTQEVWWLVL